jgi:hypothetical protein
VYVVRMRDWIASARVLWLVRQSRCVARRSPPSVLHRLGLCGGGSNLGLEALQSATKETISSSPAATARELLT